jgi:hypothetical protein
MNSFLWLQKQIDYKSTGLDTNELKRKRPMDLAATISENLLWIGVAVFIGVIFVDVAFNYGKLSISVLMGLTGGY